MPVVDKDAYVKECTHVPIIPVDVHPCLPSEMFLLCCTDISGGRIEVICVYPDKPLALKGARTEILRGVNNGKAYFIKSVEVRQ
jgi:hypothetical protein